MSKLLDVAMIVKNEAENLPACLESLKALEPILGGIYIYDTGSSDGTQDIARSYGATVQQGYWDDDFARAKNEAIKMCESKWALVVDADDRATFDVEALRRELVKAQPDVDAFTIEVALFVGDRKAGALQSARVLRRARMRYVGVVHEMPRRPDGAATVDRSLPPAILAIDHTGYTAATLPAKLARNLRLAEAAGSRATREGDQDELCAALIDQARVLWAMDRRQEAVDCYREMAALNRPGRYFVWGLELYAEALLETDDLSAAAAVIERLAALGSSEGRVTLFRARHALAEGDFPRALELARTVNRNEAAVELTHSTATIIHTRMMAALHCQEHEEALACLLQLVVAHRAASAETLSLLTKLWGGRPAEVLAQILSDAPADFIPQIAQELATQDGIGPQVAQSLLSRVEPALSGAPATT